jgi:hypothetical protein
MKFESLVENAICDDVISLHLASMMQLRMKSDNPFYKFLLMLGIIVPKF